MKAKFSIIGLTAILFTTAWTAPAPINDRSAETVSVATKGPGKGFSLRVHRQGKGVTAIWEVESSQGVVGFLLQKTYEDPNDVYAVWEDVSSIPCVGSRSYKCTDNNVYPGTINYRVIGQKGDGNTIVSGLAVARIVSH